VCQKQYVTLVQLIPIKQAVVKSRNICLKKNTSMMPMVQYSPLAKGQCVETSFQFQENITIATHYFSLLSTQVIHIVWSDKFGCFATKDIYNLKKQRLSHDRRTTYFYVNGRELQLNNVIFVSKNIVKVVHSIHQR